MPDMLYYACSIDSPGQDCASAYEISKGVLQTFKVPPVRYDGVNVRACNAGVTGLNGGHGPQSGVRTVHTYLLYIQYVSILLYGSYSQTSD